MARRVRGNVNDYGFERTKPDPVPLLHPHVERWYALKFGVWPGDPTPRCGLDFRVAAGVIGVPMGVPDLRDPPAARFRLRQNGSGNRRVNHHRLARDRLMDQPDVIVRKDRNADNFERHHQCPTLAIETHGSFGVSASPACNSSTEILSGERTKAMRPSRGGRFMVTPPSLNRWHVA